MNPLTQMQVEVDEARVELEELMESGDLEEQLEAAQRLADMEAQLLDAEIRLRLACNNTVG